MGLDMYLEKRTYVKNWEHTEKEKINKITVRLNGKIRKDINAKNISYIIEEACYWRKENAIHNWFVKNCQEGVDDCKEYSVSREQLKDLVSVCEDILKNKKLAPTLLPTQEGFFFGGKEYDQYYFDCLKYTKSTLEELLSKTPDDWNVEYYYRSSW